MKAATRRNWNEVWDAFDRRKAAVAVNEDAGDGDMFSKARIAAE